MLPREEKTGREDRVIEVVAAEEEEVLVESDMTTRMVLGMKDKVTEGEVILITEEVDTKDKVASQTEEVEVGDHMDMVMVALLVVDAHHMKSSKNHHQRKCPRDQG